MPRVSLVSSQKYGSSMGLLKAAIVRDRRAGVEMDVTVELRREERGTVDLPIKLMPRNLWLVGIGPNGSDFYYFTDHDKTNRSLKRLPCGGSHTDLGTKNVTVSYDTLGKMGCLADYGGEKRLTPDQARSLSMLVCLVSEASRFKSFQIAIKNVMCAQSRSLNLGEWERPKFKNWSAATRHQPVTYLKKTNDPTGKVEMKEVTDQEAFLDISIPWLPGA